MPYFVRVGNFAENKGGLGARGYHVYRRGRKVITVWGAITVDRARQVRFTWARTTEHKVYTYRSVERAKAKWRALVSQRTEREGYERLKPGLKITRTKSSLRSHHRA